MSRKSKIFCFAVLAGLAFGPAATPGRAASVTAKQFTAFLTRRQVVQERRFLVNELRTDQRIFLREVVTLIRLRDRGRISQAVYLNALQTFQNIYIQEVKTILQELAALTPFR